MIVAPGIFAAVVFLPLALLVNRIHRGCRRRRCMRTPLSAGWIEIIRQGVELYSCLPEELKTELHGHVQNFLAEKHFEGCGGLTLTEEMKVTIAAQACILLLNRKTTYFPKCDSILVYPSAYIATQKRSMGAVQVEERSVRLGESWTQGTVVLAWDEVAREARDLSGGRNVVLHEFAHQLDQEDGMGDGTPILESRGSYAEWARVLGGDFLRLRDEVRHHDRDVIDAYGATNEAEFFAVATEAFFDKGAELRRRHPDLYEQLKKYYRMDPAEWKSR